MEILVIELILNLVYPRVVSGPILFNINMIDLFYEGKDSNVASYADDTTPYLCATDIPSGIKLELTIPLELKASATI